MNNFRVLSVSNFDPKSPAFHGRRVIRYKSRDGCQMCKAKKVKCDETKPVCVRCRRNKRTCEYSVPEVQARIHPSPPSSDDDHTGQHVSNMELVHHCQTQWSAIFPGFDQNANFMAAYKSSQLVRSVCHALAASHLRHLRPGHRPYILAEYSYRATAMLEYKAQLQFSAEELGQTGVNTMLLSAILFSLLAFPLSPLASASVGHSLDDPGPWIADEHDAEMGWLTFQAGLGPLMRSVAVYLPGASKFLATIFAPGSDAAMWPNVGQKPPPIPEPWIAFFHLDEGNDAEDIYSQSSSSPPSAPWERPPPLETSVRLLVRITAYLRSLPPTLENSVVYLAFTSKAQKDFRTLLLLQDPRAWWLYGYWAGLLCRFRGGLWWFRDRAARQYAAVRRWLGCLSLGNEEDGDLWMEMLAELDSVTAFPPRHVHFI